MTKRVTIPEVIRAKSEGRKLTMLTAYDHLTAKLLDEAGIDMLLVGDSVGTVNGLESTIPVTMKQMIYHTELVARGTKRAIVVSDMPFGSYQVSIAQAVKNAIKLVKAGGNAIKLEGGRRVANQVRAIVNAEIPVMGHLGLTPQSENKITMRVQAKTEYEVERLVNDAILLEESGCFAIVLEAVPTHAAKRVTEAISIPTIGIGAGPFCDGQVLVYPDIIGLTDFSGKFVKIYADIKSQMMAAVKLYKEEVLQGIFPSEEYSYNIDISSSKPSVVEKMSDYKVLSHEEIIDD